MPELAPDQRINARGRLIQEQHRRGVQHCRAQREALLDPQRQQPGPARPVFLQPQRADHPLDRLARRAAIQAIGSGYEFQVRRDGQVAIKRELLRHIAHGLARGGTGGQQVAPGHGPPTAAGREQSAEHPERGRLARAIGAKQAENLTRRDREGNVLRGREAAITPGQAHGRDRRLVRARFAQREPGGKRAGGQGQAIVERGGKAFLGAGGNRLPARTRWRGPGPADNAQTRPGDRGGNDIRPFQRGLQRLAAARIGQRREPDLARRPLRQTRGRPGIADLPVMQQQHVVAALRILEDRGRPDNAAARTGEFLRQLPDFPPRDRIDPNRRFIEQHQRRRGHDSACQREFLAHPPG